MTRAKVLILLLFLIFCQVEAKVILPKFFSDHMILQRDLPIKIWGKADKGETVIVSFNNQNLSTKADRKGDWSIELDAMKAGGPYEMKISGKSNALEFKDILIGDVWICSGQSNMEWRLKDTDNAEEAINKATNSNIRLITVKKTIQTSEQFDIEDGKWELCTPETARDFSAVGYFFGKELQQDLNIPIGLIHTSWGGTDIQTWTSWETMTTIDEKYQQYAGKKIDKVFKYDHTKDNRNPNVFASLLYNGMLKPLIGYGIKGAIWYQGENNAHEAFKYRTLFPAMINDWRKQWGYDFPFFWVQLANFMKVQEEPVESNWAELREAQNMTLSLPYTGQAVITDIGDAEDIHPRNKKDVGYRLALNALKIAYGKDILASGPVYDSMRKEGDKIVITFKNIGKGLSAKDKNKYGYLKGFAIAGADKKFVWAKAYIQDNKVIVFSEKTPNPVAVRYAWADNPDDNNLVNSADLLASPFRTDNWKGITDKK